MKNTNDNLTEITSISATTYYNLPPSTFTGGTVVGATNFTGGLTANTISATTYSNLPTDVRVTGGTYSDGTTTFTNNVGGSFTVTGQTTPFTGGTVSGATTFLDTTTFTGVRINGYVLNNTLTVASSNSSNTVYTNIWTFNGVAGQTYKMEMIGTYQTAALNTGIKIRIGGTALCNVAGKIYGAIGNTAVNTELAIMASTMTSELVTTGVGGTNSPHFIGCDVIFKCNTSGTIIIQMATEINLSAAQLNIGTTCVVERLL